MTFVDALTGASLLSSGSVSVGLELLLGKSWSKARDEVVIPAYRQALARQEQLGNGTSRGGDRGGFRDELVRP
jgi:hypothetical protein